MASSSYAVRADAIQSIAIGLRRRLELASVGTVSDKMSVIDASVEVINKILYCFLVSQELYDSVEDTLNRFYRDLQPIPSAIDRMFNIVVKFVHQFEQTAAEWVAKYAK